MYYQISDTQTKYQCTESPEDIIPALQNDGYETFVVRQSNENLIPFHRHETDEIIVVISGTVEFNVEEKKIRLETGELILIKAEAVHAALALDTEAVILLGLKKGRSDLIY